MASISLRGIAKSFADPHKKGAPPKVVVARMDLEIADGEFVVLVGPSGCGKSTTLRMVAGLESPTEGDLLIGTTRVNDLPPGERDVAMVFQSYALYPHMTVFENIAFGLRVRNMDNAEVTRRVNEAAGMLGLGELLQRRPGQLSGGQRQRVAMGRAIVRQPRAFLFDEPLSNLDAKLRGEVRAQIARLRRQLNTTTVYVTHDQVEAMTLADRVVVMADGYVQQVGPPMEVYKRPANKFVAGFLGTPTMNFLAGSSGGGRITGNGFALDLARGAGEVTVGIRPQHAVVAGQGARLGRMEIDVVERLGAESYALGSLGGAHFTALVPDGVDAKAGTQADVMVAADQVHVFDARGSRVDA